MQCTDSAFSCSCEFSLALSCKKKRNNRGFYRRCCEWFSAQTEPFTQNYSSSLLCFSQLLGAEPERLFCFDWRIHSHCQDFRISFLIRSDSLYFTATRTGKAGVGVIGPQTKNSCRPVCLKAGRMARLREKMNSNRHSLRTICCLLGVSGYFFVFGLCAPISNLHPVVCCGSEAGLHLARRVYVVISRKTQ